MFVHSGVKLLVSDKSFSFLFLDRVKVKFVPVAVSIVKRSVLCGVMWNLEVIKAYRGYAISNLYGNPK